MPFTSNMARLGKPLIPVVEATMKMSPVAVGSTSFLASRMIVVLHSVSGVALSELVCARSITGRMALLASIVPGLVAAFHYRGRLAQPGGLISSEIPDDMSLNERPIQMAKRLARLPPIVWLLGMVSSTVLLQAFKELNAGAVRRAARIPLWLLSALAAVGVLATHKQLKKLAPVAKRRVSSELALRDVAQAEASQGLGEVGGKFLDTAIPVAVAVGHLPHGAVSAASFVAFRAAVAIRGIMEVSMSELINARSGAARLALAASIVPGWAIAFHYRNVWTKSGESATDDDENWSMQLAKKSQQLPPAYWLLTCISGSFTIHAAKDILVRHGGRGFAVAVCFLALTSRKEALQVINAVQRELKPEAVALRQPGEQQTSHQFLDDMWGRAFAALVPLSFAIRKVPLPAIASVSVLTLQTAAAFNGVFQAAMTELLNPLSVPMRVALALAVTPGWVAALSYRNMAPMESQSGGVTPIGDGTEAGGLGAMAAEEVRHRLTRMAVDARCLPPAFWMAFTASGAITLQAVSNAAAGYLRA